MKVLLVEPNTQAVEYEIENDLKAMQILIGGYVEVVYLEPKVVLVCDEEGKLKGKLPNRRLNNRDVIVGTFFVCGEKINKSQIANFVSLTKKQLKKYKNIFG